MRNVQFGDEQYNKATITKKSTAVTFLVRIGLAKNEKQASRLLVGIILALFFILFFLFFSGPDEDFSDNRGETEYLPAEF